MEARRTDWRFGLMKHDKNIDWNVAIVVVCITIIFIVAMLTVNL